LTFEPSQTVAETVSARLKTKPLRFREFWVPIFLGRLYEAVWQYARRDQKNEEVSVLRKRAKAEDDPVGMWDPPCPEW